MSNIHPIDGGMRIVGEPDGTEIDLSNAEPDADDLRSLDDMSPDDFFDGVIGTDDQMGFDFSSLFSVQESTLKVKPIPTVPVKGQFHDEDRLTYKLVIEVEEVDIKPILDRHGTKVGMKRHHIARIVRFDPIRE